MLSNRRRPGCSEGVLKWNATLNGGGGGIGGGVRRRDNEVGEVTGDISHRRGGDDSGVLGVRTPLDSDRTSSCGVDEIRRTPRTVGVRVVAVAN
eukprot:scaffold27982_cov31-Tisochrysis_lutea.AAC.4